MVTVTQRIKQVKQPRNGYINPRQMEVRQLDDGKGSPLDNRAENIHPSLVGLAVDYLTRYALGTSPEDAFRISLMGASMLGEADEAEALLDGIKGTDSQSIVNACQLAGYDVVYRAGRMGYRPVEAILPNESTIENIETMITRSLAFFDKYAPVTLDGFTLDGGHTKIVTAGDGDFLTSDTLWDFKVSIKGPQKKHTLQLLMYYLMGRRSGQAEFGTIAHLGIINPRLNAIYRIPVASIPAEVIEQVSREVIGYE